MWAFGRIQTVRYFTDVRRYIVLRIYEYSHAFSDVSVGIINGTDKSGEKFLT